MSFYTFPEQTGFFGYEVSVNPPPPTGQPFVFGFACSGCIDDTIITFLEEFVQTFDAENILLFRGDPSGIFGFVGESGKLYDSEGTYFQSYVSGDNFSISGNVFSERHNYFYENNADGYVLVNSDCSRPTGTIDAFYILNVGLDDFSLRIVN